MSETKKKPHGFLQRCEEASKQGLYLQALAFAVQHVVLAPLSSSLASLELRFPEEEVGCSELRVLLAHQVFVLPHVWRTVEQLQLEGLWGPQVLSRLQECATTIGGVAELRILYLQLLNRTSRVFLSQIRSWMAGVLRDPASELFVQEDLSKPVGSWERFQVVPSLVPRFFRPDLAEKILLIGKCSLLLGFSGQHQQQQQEKEEEEESADEMHVSGLEAMVDRLNAQVTGRLWEKLFGECAFLERLRLIRSLLLLGNGAVFYRFVKSSEQLLTKAPTKNAERDLNKIWIACYGDGLETFTWDGNYANGWDGVGIGEERQMAGEMGWGMT